MITRPQEHPSIYPLEGMSDEDIYHWVNYGQYKGNRICMSAEDVLKYYPEFGEVYEQWYQDDLKNEL